MNTSLDQNHIKNFILESGLISAGKIQETEDLMFEKNIEFLDALEEKKFLDQKTLSEISANIMGVPKVDLSEKIITLEIFKTIPEPISKEHNIVCFQKTEKTISIAFAEIKDWEVVEAHIPKNLEVKMFLADRNQIANAVEKYTDLLAEKLFFKNEKNIKRISRMENFGIRSEEELPRHLKNDIANDVYTEKFVRGMIDYALQSKSDFIFFNLSENDVEISLKISNRNYPIMNIDHAVMRSIGMSIKKQADINIFKKEIIQQSSFPYHYQEKKYTVFVTCTQTDFGESITLQIGKNTQFKTDMVLLAKNQRNALLKNLKKDSGFFVMSGTSQTGKTTTLYNFLEYDVAKHKDIYTFEHTVGHNMPYTKQISLSEKTPLQPMLVKIMRDHPDVIAVEKATSGTLPMLFNYVSTSKKVFLSYTKEIGHFIDMLIEMDFDKGQIVKNFALLVEHVKFKKINIEKITEKMLTADEVKVIHNFINEKQIQELFEAEGLVQAVKQSKKNTLSNIIFHTVSSKKQKTKTISSLFSHTNTKTANKNNAVYLRGVVDLGIFLENTFLKRFGKEKIKNTLRKEVKKKVLKNALLASHRGLVDIKEVLKYLTR